MRYLRVTGGLMVAIGTLATLGWVMDAPVLSAFLPGSVVRTVMNTALCAVASGAGFLLLAARKNGAARIAGLFVTALTAIVLMQYLSGRSVGIDQLFWHHHDANYLSFPGRMATNTAMGFFLVGLGLTTLASRRPSNWVIAVGTGWVGALALVPLGLHLSALIPGHTNAGYQGMALPTALSLLAAAVGLWSCRQANPQGGSGSLQLATAGVGMLVSIGLMTVQSHNKLNAANHWVLHTYEVQSELEHLVAEVARLESGARAYALTGDEGFVTRDTFHRSEIKTVLQKLGGLSADNPGQNARVATLNGLADQKLERSAGLIQARRAGDAADAARFLLQLSTQETSALVNLVDEMRQEEKRLLAERNTALTAMERDTRVVQIFGSLLAAAFLTFALVSARRAALARDVAETGLRTANVSLEQVNRLRQAIFDGTVLGVISTAPDGIVTAFSRGAERMLGYTREEMVGRQTPEVLHVAEEMAARAAELSVQLGRPIKPGIETFTARARAGNLDEREWTCVRKDGTRLPVQLSVTALRDDANAITGFLGIVQDLTERKKAEVALQASEERLGQVLGHADCLVWEAQVSLANGDWSWRISVYPSGLYRRLNDGREQSKDAGLWYRFDVPEREEMNRRSRDAMERGLGSYVQEFRIIKDGNVTWLRETVAIRPQADGHFWLVGVVIDVTERKQLEMALLSSEEQFRNAFDFAGIGMALVGLDGRWLKVNRVLCRVLDYTEEELLAKSFQDITHPDDLHADLAHLQDLLAGRIDHYEMEKRYIHRAGHVVHAQLTVSLVRDAARAPVHFVSQVADITQSKQIMASLAAARDEALAASRLKSEFLANMSHEIRTPMNGVIGMADLLLDSTLSADQRQMGQVIRSSAENLLTIINDILDFSKIEAGKLSIESQDFSLAEEVLQSVALLTPPARDRGLTITTEFPPDLPPGLSGDAGRIQQVLVNLVGNAVKFTETGEVVVAVQSRRAVHAGRYAFRVEVRDTGIGIAPGEGERLFQPFIQADGSTTRKYGGTGLGLAISQQLVGLMNGRIGFESEVGEGSVFWFELELPVVAVMAAVPGAALGAPLTASVALAACILVAEDNPANQLVIRLLLQKLGLTFDIVADGVAVLERLAARDYAAVLMDCQMPQLDGYDTTRRIRAQAGGVRQPRIPIIALTAHAQASDRDKCLDAGMDAYLSKPIRLDALQEAFQRVGIAVGPVAPAPVVVAVRTPVLDAAQLAQLRELPGRTGGTLLDDLIGMVLQDLPPEFARLHAAVERCDAVEVGELAHRLAGSAANIGATGLRKALQDLEYAGRKAEWPSAARGRIALDREWTSVREALQSLQHPPS